MMTVSVRAGVLLGVIGSCLVTASTSRAEERDFDLGSREWNVQVKHVGERRGEDQSITDVSFGYGYFFLDRAVIEGQLVGYYAHDEEDAVGIGGSLVARYHLLVIDRFSLYGEIGGGILETSEDFPDGGTKFNFTYFGGPGASFRMTDHLHLVGGLIFQHLSNGFIEGRDRNPVLNSLGGYVGLMRTF